MGRARNWTDEDKAYLAENWGSMTVPGLCKTLNRSATAIKIMVQRLGLPPFLDAGEYITLNQLVIAVTGSAHSYSHHVKCWGEKRGLPIRNKRVEQKTWRVVYLDEFWEWAEVNKSFIDFSKMEPLVLGEEPDWVAEQRRKDYHAAALQRKDPWLPEEDSRLMHLLKKHQYGFAELSKMLRRSAGAIQRRITDLGLKERPVKACNRNKWTTTDCQALADGIRAGDSYALIGDIVGRSEKAVRGKVYYTYFTENADKVRSMLGAGQWGFGVPIPTVKQARYQSNYRGTIEKELSQLIGILAYRRNELGYEPYWQRHMCVKWHDIKGCTADCNNCDSCTEFERIQPQYCARCGCTFYEQQKDRFCAPCRMSRKKLAQRKWARQGACRV